MGMFDTICDVPVKCPRCGDEGPKSVQIKSGPQILYKYQFGKDKIDINWDYQCYGAVIDREKLIIRGIASCDKCRKESNNKMERLIEEAKKKEEINIPEDAKYLIQCKINEENALGVILDRLEDAYGGSRDIELFEVAIWLDKDYIPISADTIVDMNDI